MFTRENVWMHFSTHYILQCLAPTPCEVWAARASAPPRPLPFSAGASDPSPYQSQAPSPSRPNVANAPLTCFSVAFSYARSITEEAEEWRIIRRVWAG